MQSWQIFLISAVCRKYDLSKKEQAILLAKFPDEKTVLTNKQVAQQAIADDQIPIDPETVRRQLWTIYHDRFSPKTGNDYFPDYDRKGSQVKDIQCQAWLKQQYLNWQVNTRETLPTPSTDSAFNQLNTAVNPFVPRTGRVDDPRLFFGREAEIQLIFEILNSGSSVALIGEEGIGKSSLLWAVCQQAGQFLHSPRQPVYLDLNWVQDEDEFYGALCDEIGISESKGYALTRHLRSQRILLAIDNLGKMMRDEFTRQVRDQLRGLAEGTDAPLRLVLAATESLDTLFNDSQEEGKTSPLTGVCQEEIIKPWNVAIARAFVCDRLIDTSVQFSDAEITLFIQTSAGHPQQFMQLCYEAYASHIRN